MSGLDARTNLHPSTPCKLSGFRLLAEGNVTNDGTVVLENVSVTIPLFDAEGNIIGSAEDHLNIPLDIGKTWAYSIQLSKCPETTGKAIAEGQPIGTTR